MEKAATPHIALLPAPGMGHVLPFIEFAKQLVDHHNFHATFIIPSVTTSPPVAMKEVLQALPPTTFNHIFLPLPDIQDLPQDTDNFLLLIQSLLRSLPSIRDTLQFLKISSNDYLVAIIVSPSLVDVFDISKELNLPSYVFFPCGASLLSFFFYFKKLNDMGLSLPEMVQLPGCMAFHKSDLLQYAQNPNDETYRLSTHISRKTSLATGILVNSFSDLEPGVIRALQYEDDIDIDIVSKIGKFHDRPPMYLIGPIVRNSGLNDGIYCLKWLDSHPCGTVLFVSFGSGGTLSQTQMDELALGLEMSGKKFIWVVRNPNNETSDGSYFNIQTQKDPLGFLPNGFIDRTKKRGLLVPSWAPQTQILSHVSVGGFLTHCGWNSILESVVNGVPLIAWPLFSEQKMNAAILCEDIKVALRPKVNENGIVEKEEIAKIIKELLGGDEGMRIRGRMEVLKEAARKVMGENGSSTIALSNLSRKWKNKERNNYV